MCRPETYRTSGTSSAHCSLLSAGHYERKLKHLENQKEGKRRMKRIGTVDLPQEAFFEILSTKT